MTTTNAHKFLLPEPFDGTGDIQAYVTQFELLSSLQNWLAKAKNTDGTDRVDGSGNPIYIDQRHQIFPLRLRGSAIEFFRSLDPAVQGDYKQLRKEFLRQYQEPPEFFRSSLAKRVQGESEKITEFLSELKLLASKAYPLESADVRNHLVLQTFIEGIHNVNVRVELRKLKTNSIEAALENAIHFDAVYRLESSSAANVQTPVGLSAIDVLTQKLDTLIAGQLSSNRSRQSGDKRSFNKNRNSPGPSSSWRRKARTTSGSSSRENSDRSKSRSTSGNRRVRFEGKLICFGCNREGHIKNDCKNCWNCGSSQHLRRNCPKLRSDSK